VDDTGDAPVTASVQALPSLVTGESPAVAGRGRGGKIGRGGKGGDDTSAAAKPPAASMTWSQTIDDLGLGGMLRSAMAGGS